MLDNDWWLTCPADCCLVRQDNDMRRHHSMHDAPTDHWMHHPPSPTLHPCHSIVIIIIISSSSSSSSSRACTHPSVKWMLSTETVFPYNNSRRSRTAATLHRLNRGKIVINWNHETIWTKCQHNCSTTGGYRGIQLEHPSICLLTAT